MGSGLPWTHSKTSSNSKTCGERVPLLGKCGKRTRTKLGLPQLILFVSLHALFKLPWRCGGTPQYSLFRGTLGRYRNWLWRDGAFIWTELFAVCVAFGGAKCPGRSRQGSTDVLRRVC